MCCTRSCSVGGQYGIIPCPVFVDVYFIHILNWICDNMKLKPWEYIKLKINEHTHIHLKQYTEYTWHAVCVNMVVPLSCQNPDQMANCRHHIVVPVPPLDTAPTIHVPLAVPHHSDSDRCGSDGLELFSLIAGNRKKNHAAGVSHQRTSYIVF